MIIRVAHRLLLTLLALWAGFWLLVYLTSGTGYPDSGRDMAIWCGLGIPGATMIVMYGLAWTIRGFRAS